MNRDFDFDKFVSENKVYIEQIKNNEVACEDLLRLAYNRGFETGKREMSDVAINLLKLCNIYPKRIGEI